MPKEDIQHFYVALKSRTGVLQLLPQYRLELVLRFSSVYFFAKSGVFFRSSLLAQEIGQIWC